MSESAPSTEIPLTRKEKEVLLQRMYTLPHWIAVIRLFGYQAIHMGDARNKIKPIAEEYGKEPVAQACEALVEIFNESKEPFARLKSHIRRMAFQILGPEPPPNGVAPTVTSPPEPPTDREPPRPPEKRKARKPASAPSPAAPKTAPASSAIMQQYQAAKEKHPDMILLFRLGDFYEMFDEDAEVCHKILGLTLTTRDRIMKMTGFPHHQLETYLHKLLKAGQRVAVCDQMDESLARGPIRREITRVVTPGMADDDSPQREKTPDAERKPVKQPRHFVLKQYETWMNQAGLAFVAIEDVKRTTPAVQPFVAGLDFIVLREETKFLVTVRPHLQAKHLKAIGELQTLFGLDYRPVRVWPTDGPDGWDWQEFPTNAPGTNK